MTVGQLIKKLEQFPVDLRITKPPSHDEINLRVVKFVTKSSQFVHVPGYSYPVQEVSILIE